MTYDVTDLVDNDSSSVINTQITYDITPPEISEVGPSSGSYVNTKNVSYTLSEACASGTVTWTRTGGVADDNSPHEQALSGSELNAGEHSDILLTNEPNLISGTVYSITFNVTDNANNQVTSPTMVTNIMYDTGAPEATVDIVNGAYSENTWSASTITGGSTDSTLTGSVQCALTRYNSNGSESYWNGSDWTTAVEETWRNATGTNPWTYNITAVNLTDKYQLSCKSKSHRTRRGI